jgi:hypothetical protein
MIVTMVTDRRRVRRPRKGERYWKAICELWNFKTTTGDATPLGRLGMWWGTQTIDRVSWDTTLGLKRYQLNLYLQFVRGSDRTIETDLLCKWTVIGVRPIYY